MSITEAEMVAVRDADAALKAYDLAKQSGRGSDLIRARQKLERVRSELTALKAGDPATIALLLCKRALEKPVDHLGRPIDPKPRAAVSKAGVVLGGRFDKLQRHGALAK